MSSREGDIAADSIVLLDQFNTAILQPAWLEAQGLFEGRNIDVREQFITPPVVVLNLAWMGLEVTEQRAAFTTTDESATPGPLRDFVVDLFRILEHTPIYGLGMNHVMHFTWAEGGWGRLSQRLAPSEPLQGFFPEAALTGLSWKIPRSDGLEGEINLKLEPSHRLTEGGWAEWNSHVSLAAPDSARGARPAVEVLQGEWDEDRRHAMETFGFVRGLA